MNPEASIINCILKTGDMIGPLNTNVEQSLDLYDQEWAFIKEYYTNYREVPPIDVFESKFPSFDTYVTEGTMEHYIDQVHQYKAKKVVQELLMDSAAALKERGPYDIVKAMQSQLSKLGRDTRMIADLDLVANADERLDNLRERIEMLESGRKIIGIPTGIQALDDKFGGWQKGDFVVIAGWTGSLKSWLAMYFAQHAWLEGYRVLYFSLEMSKLQIGYRFDTMLSGREGGKFTNSSLTHAKDIFFDDYKTWLGDQLKDKHPFVVVTNEELEEVTQNTVQAKIDLWRPDLVILDYHGLFDEASGIQGEVEKTKQLSKAFKRMAIKTQTPILDITAVTMKDDHGERPPNLNELAWSKQLAFDSDLTLSVCKHGNMLEVISRKARRSDEIHFYMEWDVDKGKAKDLSGKKVSSFAEDEEEDF